MTILKSKHHEIKWIGLRKAKLLPESPIRKELWNKLDVRKQNYYPEVQLIKNYETNWTSRGQIIISKSKTNKISKQIGLRKANSTRQSPIDCYI